MRKTMKIRENTHTHTCTPWNEKAFEMLCNIHLVIDFKLEAPQNPLFKGAIKFIEK